MASVNLYGEGGFSYTIDSNIIDAKIDNRSCFYTVGISRFPDNSSSLSLLGVRVDYYFSNFLPAMIQ